MVARLQQDLSPEIGTPGERGYAQITTAATMMTIAAPMSTPLGHKAVDKRPFPVFAKQTTGQRGLPRW